MTVEGEGELMEDQKATDLKIERGGMREETEG
jgi:hypothetical protein